MTKKQTKKDAKPSDFVPVIVTRNRKTGVKR